MMRRSTRVVAWFCIALGAGTLAAGLVLSIGAGSLFPVLGYVGIWAVYLGIPTALALALLQRQVWAWWALTLWLGAAILMLLWIAVLTNFMAGMWPRGEDWGPQPVFWVSWLYPIPFAATFVALVIDPPRRWARLARREAA